MWGNQGGLIWSLVGDRRCAWLIASVALALSLRGRSVTVELGAKVRRLEKLRRDERAGRIGAEKKLKEIGKSQPQEFASSAPTAECYPLAPIGHLRTCFPNRNGTPRQPFLVPASRGRLDLDPELPSSLLEGLDQYSHCWVVYIFHENTNAHALGGRWKGVKGKIQVPRLNGGKMGALSTRTPHRPNPIGLSLAKVDRVDLRGGRRTLHVSGHDIVDGSPVLDVKPYLPFCEALADASAPDWVTGHQPGREPLRVESVVVSSEVEGEMHRIWEGVRAADSLYADAGEVLQLIREVLARDIRSVHQRLSRQDEPVAQPAYVVRLEGLQVTYEHEPDAHIKVTGVTRA